MIVAGEPFQSRAAGVGQNEQPFSSVRRADFARAEDSRFNSVTQLSKVSPDDVEPEVDVSWDVLEEAPGGANLRDDALDEGPEMSLVVGSFSVADEAERLAGVAAREEIHSVAVRAAVEG